MSSRFIIFLVFGFACAQAQIGATDSLQRVLQTATSDSVRIDALNELSSAHRQRANYDSAILFAQKARALSAKTTNKLGSGRAYNMLGNAYMMQGNWPESLQAYFASLKRMEEAGEKRGVASCLGNIGNIYYYQADYADALRYHRAAFKIKQELGDKKGMVFTLNSLANIYINQSNYAEGRKIFLQVLSLLGQNRGADGAPVDKRGLAVTLQGLGNIYFYEGDYASALQKYTETLQVQEETGNRLGIANSLINVGATYNKLGHPERGLSYCLRGRELAGEIGSMEMQKESCEALSFIEEELGRRSGSAARYRSALAYYKEYIAFRDTLLNEENTKATVRLEMNYAFEKKEETARLEQARKDAVAQAEARRQRLVLFAISGFGLLVLGFAVFAYRSFLQKKRANEEITRQKELIEEKQKEILDSIHYAKRIQTALIPTERNVARYLKKARLIT